MHYTNKNIIGCRLLKKYFGTAKIIIEFDLEYWRLEDRCQSKSAKAYEYR